MNQLKEKQLSIPLEEVQAKIVYPQYGGFTLNTLLIFFPENRRVFSTWDGYRDVQFVGNTYVPYQLAVRTMRRFAEFHQSIPPVLGLTPDKIAFLCTCVSMDNLVVCQRSSGDLKVCILATAGVKMNALRVGVDAPVYDEPDESLPHGTINVILLTNGTLTDGAMARAIITITEAKTAALQDLDVRSTYNPQNQATGTETDNVLVVSGRRVNNPLHLTTHPHIMELIGFTVKNAVTEAVKKSGC